MGHKQKKLNIKLCYRIDEDLDKYILEIVDKTNLDKSVVCRNIMEAAKNNKRYVVNSHENYLLKKELIQEINKIGININQIVKDVNQHFYTDYEKIKLFALQQKILDLVIKAFENN